MIFYSFRLRFCLNLDSHLNLKIAIYCPVGRGKLSPQSLISRHRVPELSPICPKVFSKLSPSYLKMFQVVLKLSQFVSKLSHICLKVVAKFFAIIPNFQNVSFFNILLLCKHDIGLNHLTHTPFGHFSFSSILFLRSMTSASG